MHNFVYLARRRSQEFSCEPIFWGGVPSAPPWLRQWRQVDYRRDQGTDFNDEYFSVVTNPHADNGQLDDVACNNPPSLSL